MTRETFKSFLSLSSFYLMILRLSLATTFLLIIFALVSEPAMCVMDEKDLYLFKEGKKSLNVFSNPITKLLNYSDYTKTITMIFSECVSNTNFSPEFLSVLDSLRLLEKKYMLYPSYPSSNPFAIRSIFYYRELIIDLHKILPLADPDLYLLLALDLEEVLVLTNNNPIIILALVKCNLHQALADANTLVSIQVFNEVFDSVLKTFILKRSY